MKRTQKKLHRKTVAILAVVLVLVALAGSISAYYVYRSTHNNSSSTTQDDNTSSDPSDTTEDANADSDGKQQFLDSESTPSNAQPFTSDKISITTQETGTSITVATKLSGFTGAGTCTLKVTKAASTVTQSAEVIYQPEYSTCAGFSIEKAKLGPGTWKVELTVEDEGKAYSQISEFTIKP